MKKIALALTFLFILIMPNPLQTIAKSTRDQALLAVPKRTFIATVASVDYTGQRITIFVDANSAAREVHLATHEKEAIAKHQVAPGQKISILQEGSEFYGLSIYPGTINNVYLPLIGNVVSGGLSVPTNWRIVQIGTNLYASWNAVLGAAIYEIWQNNSVSPSGATIANNGTAQGLSGTNYSWVLNPGSNSNLIVPNPGFEYGSLQGWTISATFNGVAGDASPFIFASNPSTYSPSPPPPSDIVKSGAWTSYFPGSHTFSGTVFPAYPAIVWELSNPINIVGGSGLTISAWYTNYLHVAGYPTINLIYRWQNAAGTWSADIVAASVTPTGANATPVQLAATVTLDATAVAIEVGARIDYSDTNHDTPISMDDFSAISVPTNLIYYAIRAVDINGRASPFSAWVQPVQQSAALGATSTAHLQQNPIAAGNISNILAPTVGVAQTPQGFTDTGWNVPLISAANPVAETWTYASATTFTVAGNVIGRYYSGVKLRLKQGAGYLYYTVSSASYSAPNTTVTIAAVGAGANLANAAITDNYYSYQATPQGFSVASGYPTHAALWHDESVALTGAAISIIGNQNQRYDFFAQQGGVDGDSWTQTFFLASGTYTFGVLYFTQFDRGKIDFYVDGVAIQTGLDTYSGGAVYNAISTTASVSIITSGLHTLKGIVNGKNALSSGYYVGLTKMWFS